jgi:glyoxylase-like metal-dependent hydrolase (beta-lactamase superfamily II)/rhodanese-related sulfurtransferase
MGVPVTVVPAVDPSRQAIVTGVLTAHGRPLRAAWVRLLDQGGEFVGEVVTGENGGFCFYVTPGQWVVRALSSFGVIERAVRARLGEPTTVALEAAPQRHGELDIVPIATPTVGDRSYLISDGAVAVAVDPQRDIDRVLNLLDERSLALAVVLETHLHNDYVSGGLTLARECDARYVVPAGPALSYDAVRVGDGDLLTAGQLTVQAIATPGHTDHHMAYAVGHGGGAPSAVCTGGSMLYGATGRTDLQGRHLAEPLAHRQYHSVRRLGELLAGDTLVLPTHGFGSFCAASAANAVDRSSIGDERSSSPAFRLGEDAFVAETLGGLEPYPTYYAQMARLNAGGTAAPPLERPRSIDMVDLARRLEAGEWVIDIRPRRDYAQSHLRGSVNIDASDALATYVGWLVPFGVPLTLIARSETALAEAQRELYRIGYHPLGAAIVGEPVEWAPARSLAGFPRVDFATVGRLHPARDPVVLDVRRDRERAEGYLAGTAHVPIHELPGALTSLPTREIWVHCALGFRASIAASLIANTGRDVVLIDDAFANAAASGRELLREAVDEAEPHADAVPAGR